MARRLLILNGLAAFAVVVHHAAAYGLNAMFGWFDQDFTLIGSPAYYVTMFVRILVFAAVPAFFFVSGFFIGAMARGSSSHLRWTATLPRIQVLLVPFVLWTIIRFALIRAVPGTLDEILNPYFFVPVLVQFYLLSSPIAAWAKSEWKSLLLVAGIIQLTLVVLSVLRALEIIVPGQEQILDIPLWFFIRWPFWFPFGVVTGIHLQKISKPLARVKWPLLAAMIVLPILALLEYQAIARFAGQAWLGPTFGGIARTLYALAVILCFLAFERISVPFSAALSQLGTKSLGIYMGNIPAIYVVAVLLHDYFPWSLDYQFLYQPLLIVAGLGGPLLLMEIVRRTQLRPLYRYAFG